MIVGEVKTNKQVLVSFSVGKYKDEVLYDVIPMHAGHILLGRPWQFDRKVNHDGFKNKNSFVKDNKTITLVSFTSRYEDQMKLKRENDLKKKIVRPRVQKKTMRKRVKRKERVKKMRDKQKDK